MSSVRLGELLLKAGVLTEPQLEEALGEHAETGGRLGQILVRRGVISEAHLVDTLARISALPRLSLREVEIETAAMQWVTPVWSIANGIVPLWIDRERQCLFAAIADPTEVGPVDELAIRSGLEVTPLLASEREVEGIIRHHSFGEAVEGLRPSWAPTQPESTAQSPAARASAPPLPPLPALSPLPPLPPLIGHPHPTSDPVAALAPLIEVQQVAAVELQALFELCVARGLIDRREYLSRLDQLPD